jgi:DNA-binding MarR family transcriptional regulator
MKEGFIEKSLAMPIRLPCACATLRRAARVVTQMYDEQLREVGLRITQFTILQALSELGEITQGRLGDALAIDSTTLSRTLRLLEKEGLILSTAGSDRRERYWQLTREGKRKLALARPLWKGAQQRLHNELGESGWDKLWAVCDKTVHAVDMA